jgi:hypothetical protein
MKLIVQIWFICIDDFTTSPAGLRDMLKQAENNRLKQETLMR